MMPAILSKRIFLSATNGLSFRLLTVRKNPPPHAWGGPSFIDRGVGADPGPGLQNPPPAPP